jgi:hypothetical protein
VKIRKMLQAMKAQLLGLDEPVEVTYLGALQRLLRRIGGHIDTTRAAPKPWRKASDATPRHLYWGRFIPSSTWFVRQESMKYRGMGRARRSWAEAKAARPAKGGAR